MNAPEISFAIPCHNEQENLRALIGAIADEAARLNLNYEIVITDDRSTDGSWELLKALAEEFPSLRAQRLKVNSGQSAAVFAAIRAARGRIVVTLDADLQNDPRDLAGFLKALEHADCVCGARGLSRARSDSWLKNVISRVSNSVRGRVLGDPITDAGCGYRAFRRECVRDIPFFRGVHRFLPILLAMQGFRVTEVPVTNQPRHGGRTHYGLFTRAGAIVDMFAVLWMKSRMRGFEVEERLPE